MVLFSYTIPRMEGYCSEPCLPAKSLFTSLIFPSVLFLTLKMFVKIITKERGVAQYALRRGGGRDKMI